MTHVEYVNVRLTVHSKVHNKTHAQGAAIVQSSTERTHQTLLAPHLGQRTASSAEASLAIAGPDSLAAKASSHMTGAKPCRRSLLTA